MVRTKNLTLKNSSESQQHSNPPSAPPTKRRKITPRPKAKTPLQSQPQPKAKGVVIKEPIVTRAQAKKSSSIGKGKSAKSPSPLPSNSSTPSFTPKPSKKPKYDRNVAKAMASILDQLEKGQSSKKSKLSDEKITSPPKGFNVSKLVESQKYLTQFSRRKVCKTHYVDLKLLQEVLKRDLSPYLDPFMPWLSIKLPFCTKVITHFYCNLEFINEPDRTSAEEEMTTSVRGQKILISPSRINMWLGIENPPDDIYSQLEPNQIFSVLRPGELVGPLNFKPSDMCDHHRVLWYIYSRSLVNKANNYTHFSDRDYRWFASLLLKEQKDLGEYIFSEMKRYRVDGKATTPMPYPQIVSLILKKNKIWYLESKEPIEWLTPVGRNQIGKLNIDIPLKGPLESGSKKKKTTEAETSKMDDTQSSAPTATTSSPSFLNATIQHFMENILRGFHVDIANTNAELVTHLNHKMGELVDKMDKRHEELLAEQRAQGETLRLILARLDSLGPGPSAGPSSSAPPPPVNLPSDPPLTEAEPSAPMVSSPPEPQAKDILYTVDNPDTNETIHITIDDSPPKPQPEPSPQPIPSPTHTEVISPSSSSEHHTQELDTPPEVETTMVVYQPSPLPPRDDIHIPPVNLPEPISSSSSSGSDDSLVLPVKPISMVKPSSPPHD